MHPHMYMHVYTRVPLPPPKKPFRQMHWPLPSVLSSSFGHKWNKTRNLLCALMVPTGLTPIPTNLQQPSYFLSDPDLEANQAVLCHSGCGSILLACLTTCRHDQRCSLSPAWLAWILSSSNVLGTSRCLSNDEQSDLTQ